MLTSPHDNVNMNYLKFWDILLSIFSILVQQGKILTYRIITEDNLMKEAVATMVIRDAPGGHEVLLLKRSTRPYSGDWFAVEGMIDSGESPEEAVIREIHEETRLTPLEIYRESTRIVPSGPAQVRLHIYVTFVSYQSTVILNEEHTAMRWCSTDKALELLPLPAQRAALIRIQARFLNVAPQ
jgi:8-oxo-dGTP pyrophosphatase MutT (NUDIX family)